jgi:hypothetical protein
MLVTLLLDAWRLTIGGIVDQQPHDGSSSGLTWAVQT